MVCCTLIIFLFYWFIILHYNYFSVKIINILVCVIFLINYLIVFCKNPGILGREYYADTFRFESEEDKLNYQQCNICNIIFSKSFEVFHCNKCGICIIKRSHHCTWIGKCVGENNIILFLIFFYSLIGYFIILFISLIFFFIYIRNKYI